MWSDAFNDFWAWGWICFLKSKLSVWYRCPAVEELSGFFLSIKTAFSLSYHLFPLNLIIWPLCLSYPIYLALSHFWHILSFVSLKLPVLDLCHQVTSTWWYTLSIFGISLLLSHSTSEKCLIYPTLSIRTANPFYGWLLKKRKKTLGTDLWNNSWHFGFQVTSTWSICWKATLRVSALTLSLSLCLNSTFNCIIVTTHKLLY